MPAIRDGNISGVSIVAPDIRGDNRGVFVETYRREWIHNSREMIQSNRADRQKGCVVGLHYHLHQADYWYVPSGRARVVLYDLRVGSPTHGVVDYVELGVIDGHNKHECVYIPPGVAHGFAAIDDMTITYMVDGYYNHHDENGVAWNDPAIGADWGVENPVLSERDRNNPYVADIPAPLVPHYWLR